MFSLRPIVHQACHFRPTFATTHTAGISTSALRRNEAPKENEYSKMLNIIEQEADKQDDRDDKVVALGSGSWYRHVKYREYLF